MLLELIRDDEASQKHNWGKFFVDGKYFCETLEDEDRYLEAGGEKIDGETAVPRGRYKVTITYSNRFGRDMPLVCDVPGFSGVRLHGGNTEDDTHGCPLLGQVRTATGVAQCSGANSRLFNLISAQLAVGEDVWLEVK